MAFLPYSYDHGQPLPSEYVPAAAGDIEIGMCMAITNGRAAASAAPAFIALCHMPGAAADTLIPVMRVDGGTVFESTLSASAASLVPGSKAGVSANGLEIDPSATNKNIEIISADGTAKGDKCRCRFI